MKCHQCGYELPEKAKFCRSCGVSQIQAPIDQAPATPTADSATPLQSVLPKCIKCGYEMEAKAKFCRSCGANQVQIPADPPIVVEPTVVKAVEPQPPVAAVIEPIESSPPPPIVAPQVAPVKTISPITPSVQPVSAAPKSNTALYAAIGILLVIIAGGAGYYGWTQKKAADELTAQVAKQQAEEQKKKADEELQAKLKEAEERGRKDAAEKARQEAELKAKQEAEDRAAQEKVQQDNATKQAAVGDLLERANACNVVGGCMTIMIEAVSPRNSDALQAAATRIANYKTFQRGDRKAARALNTKGLDEFKNNNYQAAIDLLKQAEIADPQDVEIHSNLGFVALRANQKSVAIDALTNALLLDPRRTSTWIPIAELYVLDKKIDGAIRAVLLGYEFSQNKEKSMTFFEDKANTAERVEMRPIYAAVIQKIKSGQID